MGAKSAVMAGLGAAALASCSLSGTIDTLAGEDGKRSAFELADQLCRDDLTAFVERLDPELRVKSVDQLAQVQSYCPDQPGEKRLVSYNREAKTGTGGSSSYRQFAIVEPGAGNWVRYEFILQSHGGGPEVVMSWNINATREKPEDLASLDAIDGAMPVIRLVGIGFLVLIGAIIAWLVVMANRKGRKAAERERQTRVGTP